MRECFASPEARANNAAQALCLVYGDPVLRESDGSPASFALDASGIPLVHDRIKQPTQHDSWFGYVFWQRLLGLSPGSAAFHAANSAFAMRDLHALPAPNDLHTRTYSGGVLGLRAARLGHDWLVARLRAPAPFVARSAAPGSGTEADVPLTHGCDPAVAGSLALLGRAAGRLELDVAAPRGSALVLLCSARALPGDPCGRATPLGALLVDPFAWLVRPQLARAGAPLTLLLPPERWGTTLHLQALVLEPARAWLTDALALRVGTAR